MFIGRIYRIMIGCPSDVKVEVTIAKEIIRNWSEVNSEFSKIALLPLHWSSNSFPEMGAHPQKIIDKQVVDSSDLLVCIFSSKIGTATDTAESGSIEEIEEHVKNKKPVMLYFRKKIDISSVSPEDLKKLNDFKLRMKNCTLWWEYEDENEFKDLFKQHLQEFLNRYWLTDKQNEYVQKNSEQTPETTDVKFSDAEIEMFYNWANADDQTYMVVRDRLGFDVFMGVKNGRHVNRGREEAEFNDYIQRLLKAGYIEYSRKDSKGNNLYKITKKGYDIAQNQTD